MFINQKFLNKTMFVKKFTEKVKRRLTITEERVKI